MVQATTQQREPEGICRTDIIRNALDKANLNVVRMVLLQITGDPSLEQMRVEKVPVRGGAFFADVLAPEHHKEVKDKAVALLSSGTVSAGTPPTREECRRLMEIYAGGRISDNEFAFGYEELAFEEFPRDVFWKNGRPAGELEKRKVAIIGAGISGIAMAIQLERLGIPYVILERQNQIGGTWALNTYPEAGVDTSSYLYQFKFEKNYPWSEYFPSQSETQTYLIKLATKYGVDKKIMFGTELRVAQWDMANGCWRLAICKGNGPAEEIDCDFLISASGLFATPNLPDIAGIETFGGRVFHTTAWDHSYDFTGKDVAIIGNGSTGVQLMASIASNAHSVTVYQRTPQWIIAMDNYKQKIDPSVRWLFDNIPWYWNWFCYSAFVTASKLQDLHDRDIEWENQGGTINRSNDALRKALVSYIESQIGDDPELVRRLTPKKAPMGRRLVIDNGWYTALKRDNVELVTDGIRQVTANSIVAGNGTERPVDAIILATGFQTSSYFWPVQYIGRNGVTLEQMWERDGPRAYLGMTYPGFPNFFSMFGPGSNPRAGGFYSWAEIWTRYILTAIVRTIESGSRTVECTEVAYRDYNEQLDNRNEGTVWNSDGSGGYYVSAAGRPYVNMPWRTEDYHAMVRTPDFNHLVLD